MPTNVDDVPTAGILTELRTGQPLPYGGDRVTHVSEELADAFRPGDRLVVVQDTGDVLHVPAAVHELVERVVDRAVDGFARLAACPDDAISQFFEEFADRLEDDATFAVVADANAADVAAARSRGRSTTRLELTPAMRADMIAGLRSWTRAASGRDEVISIVDHGSWRVESRRAPLGVVGFVFEGRPNVFADAVGVVRTGNAAVFRIGSDAVGTARAIVDVALDPALEAAGLPPGLVGLVDSVERSAGWALFGDRRVALAVARGSGAAVAQLGAVARQAGVPVSLHGTGGAWLIAGLAAAADRFAAAVRHSLDRKVCNTLNVCCIPSARADELVPVFLDAVEAAGQARGLGARVHVVASSADRIDPSRGDQQVTVGRADGDHREAFVSTIEEAELGIEWEWERSPEVSLVVTDDVDHAVGLCNRYSPRFVASVVSDEPAEIDRCYARLDAPFVGDGFTRWVDGQYALNTPELGLSNWEGGRLLGRAGVLSGTSVHTVRLRAHIDDPELHR